MSKKAIIIGAGPAGLTAAYELLKRTDIKPVILEKSGDIGGISKTINYKGNRMDIGGHRFFSKSDRVMKWWLNIMPLEKSTEEKLTINYQNKTHSIYAPINEGTGLHENPGLVMLVRKRLSRIYFLRKFFSYPVQLSIDTLRKLGFGRTIRILFSYLVAQLAPRKTEKSLEDFMINRFGRQLYLLFFKDYTEKVWGVACNKISAEWGAQRIKGVSISKAMQHAAQTLFKKKNGGSDISQKGTETSLIEQFLYPALGPGQLWEEVARNIEVLGGTILLHQDVKEINSASGKITSVVVVDSETGETSEYQGEYFFSTMPVKELIGGMNGAVPLDVKEVAKGLQYRDFITVGLLLEQLSTQSTSGEQKTLDLKDTWIYIQEKDVKVGRLQLFNNWSPYMVNKPGTVWIGMEYFCNKGDEFWSLTDEEIKRTAIEELEKMGLAQVSDVIDSTVQRMEKTYPAYFGTYDRFDKIRAFVDGFENLFLVGRNGMHKYNNSDHSMLTAMVAVDNISEGIAGKENIWAINTEQDYHEEKTTMESKINKAGNSEVHQPAPGISLSNNGSFKEFLIGDRSNRLYLLIAAISTVILFALFKYMFPFPSFVDGDSYIYIKMAMLNSTLDTYPLGYPMFLRLFSVFSNSDTLLVFIQYIMLQSASLFFLMTVFYFYRPSRLSKILLFIFSMVNPACLYLANSVLSDPLFIALSVLWLTLLIWIIEKPGWRILFLQIVVLYLAFIVRYNAMYYPLITVIALLLSKERIAFKVVGAAGSFLVIGLFIGYMSQKNFKLNGVRQFSAFSGWQMANNALHGYRYIDSNDRKPVPLKYVELDRMVRHYFDTTRNVLRHPQELLLANTYYMWNKPSPLQQYVYQRDRINSDIIPVKNWASVGDLYYSYGNFLIRKYPSEYIRWFLLPNVAKFYAPPVEFLEKYNMGQDTINTTAKAWFHYKSAHVNMRVKEYKNSLLKFYPILLGCINAVSLFSLLFYAMLNGFKNNARISRWLMLTLGFWLVNFGFSILAAPISLRQQVFPTLVAFASTIIIIEYIYRSAFNPSAVKVPDLTAEGSFSVS